jgi:lipase chaperone LimK
MSENLAVMVDSINKTYAALKTKVDTETAKKPKAAAQQWYNQVENLRGRLMATKNKSIFADEKRFKEELTELYAAIANNDQAPSINQMQRLDLMKKEMEAFKNEWATMLTQMKRSGI